jgi:hypothetical protein
MITLLAYVVTILSAPLVAAIALIPLMPISIWVGEFFGFFVSSALSAFFAAWCSTLIFNLFSVEKTVWLLIAIAVTFLLNDLRRYFAAPESRARLASLVGDQVGFVCAAFAFF